MVAPKRVDGVDISHHQSGTLDISGAKARGLKFLYHKATEGETFVDSNYVTRRAEARKARMPFGAYHFARAGRADARREAQHFIKTAKPLPGDLRPALDLETTEGLSLSELRAWAAAFVSEVVKLVGVKPVIYTPFDLGAADDGCVIWRPRYNNSNTPPALRWDIWQFSNGVYGVPNRLAGFGNVDLNTMRSGLRVEDFSILDPDTMPHGDTRREVEFRTAHLSLQFSDTPEQMRFDAAKLFRLARKDKRATLSGTEALDPVLRTALREAAEANGYRFFVKQSVWVAVDKNRIRKGSWKTGFEDAIKPNESKTGKHTGRGVVWASWFDLELNRVVTQGASHYITKGRPGVGLYSTNLDLNKRLAGVIRDWAVLHGKGNALVFYNGDQNIVDRTHDTFLGIAPLTSSWDELKRWENTGHGNIDVAASYDRDRAVRALKVDAHPDREIFFHTDHFLITTTWGVKVARAA